MNLRPIQAEAVVSTRFESAETLSEVTHDAMQVMARALRQM